MRLQQANSCRILTLGKVSAEHAVGQKLARIIHERLGMHVGRIDLAA